MIEENTPDAISEEESDTALLKRSSQLYREYILDHYKNPRNYGEMEYADAQANGENPVCGDAQTLFVSVADNTVEDIAFTGEGCAISQAATSILTEEVRGKDLKAIHEMDAEDMLDLIGLDLTPTRVKCAILGLQTLQRAIKSGERA